MLGISSPVFAAFVQDDSATTLENQEVSIPVLDNDSGNWVAGSKTQPTNGVAISAGPAIIYSPNPGFKGTDSFTYTVSEAGGPDFTATVTVEVLPRIDAVDDKVSTNTNTPITILVVANDTGTIVKGSFTQPSNGTLAGGGGGITYTPALGFKGVDGFTYTITNPDGFSDTATVTVAVNDVVFTDVTSAAGLDYIQRIFSWTEGDDRDPVSWMSGGAAAGDYDKDGNVDIYVTRQDDTDILYRNMGNGTFSDVTAAAGIVRGNGSNGAGWADIDNDGDLDLYVTSVHDTRFYLYINNGQGAFTEEAIARGAAIEGPDVHFGYSVTFGDFDGDGYLDIHTTEWRPDSMNPTAAPSNARLLRNLGQANPGHFVDVTEAAGVALNNIPNVPASRSGSFSFASRFADMDNDGLLDLVIASDFSESRLFWNNGDGTFTDGTIAALVGSDENGMGSTIGDVNGDGLLDWVVTSIYDPDDTCSGQTTCGWGNTGNRLFLNNGDRTFTDATTAAGVRDGYWGWGATFFDFDNDGDLDLVHTNGVQFPWQSSEVIGRFEFDPTRLFENDGTGTFTEVAAERGIFDNASGKGILTFDYDNDGDQDVLVVNNGAAPVLYRNDGGNNNGWLRVNVLNGSGGGNGTATTSIGTTVTITRTPGEVSIVRHVNAGSNFLGQNEHMIHFGLGGGSAPVFKVVIRRPDGSKETRTNVPRNTTITVGE